MIYCKKLLVATVLTVYGIETTKNTQVNNTYLVCCNSAYRLRYWNLNYLKYEATSSLCCNSAYRLRYWNSQFAAGKKEIVLRVATVLTVYGIETYKIRNSFFNKLSVATVLTVYGIETIVFSYFPPLNMLKLQQCLPFTVLKRRHFALLYYAFLRCNSTYRLRYWNLI